MAQVSQFTALDADGVKRDIATMTALLERFGEVSASPTANTMLARLKTIAEAVDGLEGFVDGVETLLTTANSLATTLNGYSDGVETLIGTSNTLATSLNGFVDGLEALLTTQATYLDGVEGKLDTLHTDLATTLAAFVDGLEGLLAAGAGKSATFTPAATSHTAGDCNGAAQTFTAIGPASREIRITSATLLINSTAVEATAWRLYLYSVTPPSALADDAAWDLPSGDQASFLGYVDLSTAVDLGSTQWVETNNINKQVSVPASGNLFGYLVNITTVTPAAVAHIVTLHSEVI